MNKETHAACRVAVTRASKYMMVVLGGPKFALVRAPCLVDCDNVPWYVLELGEQFVDPVVGL